MFGYIDVDKSIEQGHKGLWQTFMCGLCISTKNLVGNKARVTVGNDINFFNVLFHSFLNIDVVINKSRCFSSPFKKRTILSTDELTDKLSLANIMLVYLNIVDDVVDNQAKLKKRVALRLLRKSYGTSVIQWQQFNDTMLANYRLLRDLEIDKCDSIDKVCHPFASMTADFAKLVLGDTVNQDMIDLCYNMGKWVYLIDALDDIKQDFSKNNYNVFINHYHADNIDFFNNNIDEINFVMYTTVNSIATKYNDLYLNKYKCILDSVIYKHIRNKTQQILDRYTTSKSTAK